MAREIERRERGDKSRTEVFTGEVRGKYSSRQAERKRN